MQGCLPEHNRPIRDHCPRKADCLSPHLSVIQSLVAPRSVVDWLVLVQVLYREAQLLCIHKCCVLHVQKTLFCSISAQCLALKTFLSPLL